MQTLSRKQAAHLLGISLRTLTRYMKAGKYKFTKIGDGQYSEVRFTYSDLGLPEPSVPAEPAPTPVVTESVPELSQESFAPRPLSDIEQRMLNDLEFAEKYKAGLATDSLGNDVSGINERFPSKGSQSLIGNPVPQPSGPSTGTSHMDPALLSDTPDPMRTPLRNPQLGAGSTRNGSPLAAGLSQEAYDEMMNAWRRSGGDRSMAEQELAVRRSKQAIHEAFNTVRR